MGNRITDHKVHIFVGMFGSGKTEAAINFSIRMRNIFDKVSIADIDIISPYFRTRDKAEFLENKDIKVILPPKIYLNADLPIISPAVGGYISNPDYKIILDVGGNDDGIMVIGSLNNFLQNADAAVYFVINTMRPFTDSEEKISSHIDRLSQKARINVNYLICNTNIIEQTSQGDLTLGEKMVMRVSQSKNIPVAFTMVNEDRKDLQTLNERFEIKRFMKTEW
ncbi:MAG TPA: cobalamin biosynthesis protein CobQ [Petrotogaceae bacterium]|jgi:hypothetical protein|nr:cobalamin biosynthesis protein CobQ [Petrotogaceae bacterium]HOG34829.1 cobalamin biosynthesis protein CobQ [Petrotogaceae bacterium]HPA92912.1 cobalamin biosynthesis protein CobQ [Petrotogaceae bacterium]HPX16958.1 cobalamin biosynthesis protein CobQ [Petrotogaceae bacterium]HQC41534.1 cobalamin biosynthesis protein CobQ [Petrotogaceae bacterium]